MVPEPQKSGLRKRLDGIIIIGRGTAEAGAGHMPRAGARFLELGVLDA